MKYWSKCPPAMSSGVVAPGTVAVVGPVGAVVAGPAGVAVVNHPYSIVAPTHGMPVGAVLMNPGAHPPPGFINPNQPGPQQTVAFEKTPEYLVEEENNGQEVEKLE